MGKNVKSKEYQKTKTRMHMTQGVLWSKRDTNRLMRIVNVDGRTWQAMQADYFPDRSVASLRHRVRRINASISGVPTCRKASGNHVQMLSEDDESSDGETVLLIPCTTRELDETSIAGWDTRWIESLNDGFGRFDPGQLETARELGVLP